MRKHLFLTILLSILTLAVRGQSQTLDELVDLTGLPEPTTAVSLRYWFDDDLVTLKTTTTLSGATTIDASALVEGLHVVHYQAVDSKGTAGITASALFYKTAEGSAAASLRYWFDSADDAAKTTTATGATTIDASALVEGLHVVHYQSVDSKGTVGITASALFYKTAEGSTAASLRYWFDSADDAAKTTTATGATTIDASALTEGLHVVYYQAVDSKGTAGIAASALFYKTAEGSTAASLRYWFDQDFASTTTMKALGGTTTIDASALVEGVHVVYFQTIDSKGIAGVPASAMFFKLAGKEAAPAPKTIRYWFDQDETAMQEAPIASLTLTIDASRLIKGAHELHYQLVMDDGSLSPVSSRTFTNIMIMKGDANNDRRVDASDIVEIANFLLNKPSEGFDQENANANADETIDEQDIDAVSIIILSAE